MGRRGTAHLVEIDAAGLRWAKSSASSGTGTNSCVEIAIAPDSALLRCSHNRASHLSLPMENFLRFVSAVAQRQA